MEKQMTLYQLDTGRGGIIDSLTASGRLRRRLLDLGFIPGALVTCERQSLFNDPKAYAIRGAMIALRRDEAKLIKIMPIK
ncbi:ferrous iron transport protein A [Metallumcola ferriviriculae]|uniref:Ferrous iron transport protein A n=1 Tax=Metallumcola ferriviriculae TaxID=3039180 RepID=A0AAU0UPF2_9FIRM|nr:ferrous iron transport protein A [Desulfitibacteraceae bacterium MK1]